MRVMASCAMALQAVDCAEKALGADAQALFAAENIWVWWIACVLWTLGIPSVWHTLRPK